MLKKIGLGIILTASFGLMSCEDSSSSSSGGKVTVSCKVVSEDPFTIKSSEAGIGGNMTYELKDGKVVETYKFDDSSIAKDECNDMKSRGGYSKVTCDGKKVVAYSEDEMTDAEFKQYKKSLKKYCEDMDGKTVDINGWGNPDDDVPTSSSSKATSSSSTKAPTSATSCEFKLNNDVWEYSYDTGKDASGTSVKGTVRYEFKGKDVTITENSTKSGSLVKSICPTLKEEDYEDSDELGSDKMETTCNGDEMIVKTTSVIRNYKENYASKEEMMQALTTQCKNRQ
jgi:hypothetical protein